MPRTRAFDEVELLDAAVELFWAKGFRGASLSELTARTGVTNGSIYQAYGNKWGVFLAAYRVYCARRVEIVASAFAEEYDDVEQTLNAYFDAIIDDCAAHPDRRGCLMLNTISEYGTDDDISAISTAAIDGMEHAVTRGLTAVAPSDADTDGIVTTAAHAVALSQALIQLSRAGRSDAALRRVGQRAAFAAQRGLLAS